MRVHKRAHPILGISSWPEVRDFQSSQSALGNRICSWCHSSLIRGKISRCGKAECSNAVRALYSWDRCKKLILRRDGLRCVLCGDSADEVDHIIPVSLGGSGDDENLRSLCHACHCKETARLRREKNAFIAYLEGTKKGQS